MRWWCDGAGLTDRYPESVCLFHAMFGGPTLAIELQNSRPHVHDLTEHGGELTDEDLQRAAKPRHHSDPYEGGSIFTRKRAEPADTSVRIQYNLSVLAQVRRGAIARHNTATKPGVASCACVTFNDAMLCAL